MIYVSRLSDTRGGAKVVTRVDGDRFAKFRDVMRTVNAKWVPETGENVFDISRAAAVIAGLKAKGLEVRIDAFFARQTQQAVQETLQLSSEVRQRIDRISSVVTPRPFQLTGIDSLVRNKRWGLFDDMGLGKTFQLAMSIPDGAATIVVCPATIKLNWLDELARFRPDLKSEVLHGMSSFRWPTPGEVLIMNYDILPGKISGSGKRKTVDGIPEPNPNLNLALIADEAHLLKSGQSQRSILFKALKTYVLSLGGRVWLSTATEMLHGRPMELWNLLNCADLHKIAWPTGFPAFRRDFGSLPDKEGGRGKFGEIQWGKANSQVVDKLRMVSIKRLKSDVLPELPGKTYKQIRIDIDDKTKLVCDEVIQHLSAKGVSFDDVHDLVALTKVRGAGFELLSKAMSALAVAKARPALEVIATYEDSGIPLVVFSAHRAPVDLLGQRPGWEVITGDTPVHAHSVVQPDGTVKVDVPSDCTCRSAIVKRFQAGGLIGIAGTIAAMGFGLTLTRASNVMRIDRDWSPEVNRQAEDRVCRIGQKADSILVVDLVANHPLDARLLEILVRKDETISSTTRAAAVRS